MNSTAARKLLLTCVAFGGFAGLCWEIIWQLRASLAIGVSAHAAAFVLAVTMGGMTIGTLLSGRLLRIYQQRFSPFTIYGALEAVVGACGLFLGQAFDLVSSLDTVSYAWSPDLTPVIQLSLMLFIIGPPSMAMGATIPVFGLLAKATDSSVALLYGLNVLGAALGVLLLAFAILPSAGLNSAGILLAGINFAIAALMVIVRGQETAPQTLDTNAQEGSVEVSDYLAAFMSGFAILALEVLWFRAMRSAFLSTAHSFSIMLASVLLSLAAGAHLAPVIRRSCIDKSVILVLGGALVLLTAPLVERLDALTTFYALDPNLSKFLLALGVVGPPAVVLGVIFPYVLERGKQPLRWSLLHGSNTFGAIIGALGAAWIFLPSLGVAKSLWLIGTLTAAFGTSLMQSHLQRLRALSAVAACVITAVLGYSSIGSTRIIGAMRTDSGAYKVLGYEETPDYSVAVIENDLRRALFIDGFSASADLGSVGYMAWMGRLPMLLHEAPKRALIICFGRGVTAAALRSENPDRIDLVDISDAVFRMSEFFQAVNDSILDDPRVRTVVMDGRAWLRRTTSLYDVITLEPMPPTFSGMNNLYSREFYQLAKAKLNPGGTIAQWLPMHLLTPEQTRSIAATFIETFPNSVLWIYQPYRTGILVGKNSEVDELDWHRLENHVPSRELTEKEIRDSIILGRKELSIYSDGAEIITDDNQMLSYGWGVLMHDLGETLGVEYESESLERIEAAR